MGEAGDGGIFAELFEAIEQRRQGDPETSYVARTLARGTGHVAKKVGEEGVEAALAGALKDRDALIFESADLLFHLCLLWSAAGVRPEEVFAELASRRGRSGLARHDKHDETAGDGP